MRFGKLVAIEPRGTNNHGSVMWLCQCDCGNMTSVSSQYLLSGDTTSCGCFRIERIIDINKTHNKSRTRLYSIWHGIKQRCYNANAKNYGNYGGRGIHMCDEWKNNFESFYTWSIENGFDNGANRYECSIDRINVDGNYAPDNCRWTDAATQNNNSRNNRVFEYDGEIHTMAEWARIYNVKYETLRSRINRGMPFEAAIKQSHT